LNEMMLQIEGIETQAKFNYNWQLLSHPSQDIVFPSSQASWVYIAPFPQRLFPVLLLKAQKFPNKV
jgi:hypothetical protein